MGTQHIVRSAYALEKRRAVKICKEYGDAMTSAAAAVCAIELSGILRINYLLRRNKSWQQMFHWVSIKVLLLLKCHPIGATCRRCGVKTSKWPLNKSNTGALRCAKCYW